MAISLEALGALVGDEDVRVVRRAIAPAVGFLNVSPLIFSEIDYVRFGGRWRVQVRHHSVMSGAEQRCVARLRAQVFMEGERASQRTTEPSGVTPAYEHVVDAPVGLVHDPRKLVRAAEGRTRAD